MNKSYRLVWSSVRSAWTVVSELATAHVKSGAAAVLISAASMTAQAADSVVADGVILDILPDTYSSGDGVPTINSQNNGKIYFEGDQPYTITSTNAPALQADSSSTISDKKAANTGIAINVSTGAGDSAALLATNSSRLDLLKSLMSVTTEFKNALSIDSSSTIGLRELEVTQSYAGAGGDGYAILVKNNAYGTISKLNLTTNVSGVYVSNSSVSTNIGSLDNSNSIKTTGNNSFGVQVENAPLGLTNVNISTEGSGATGLILGVGGTLRLLGTNSISTTGANSTALLVKDGSTFSGTITGSLTATGANSNAIVFENTSNVISLNITNATISATDNAFLANASPGEFGLNVSNSVVNGDIQAIQSGALNIVVLGKSVLTGAIKNGYFGTFRESTWNITGNSDLGGFGAAVFPAQLYNDGSQIKFVNVDGSAPTAAYTDFKTLSLTAYTSTGDANIYMNTRLNGDDVTGAGSDKIVLANGGKLSGTTTFHFANAGGTGAPTYDGIKFVDAQNSGTVDTSQLKIAGGYVAAGAFAYVGRQGQYSDLTDSQSLFLTNYVPAGATLNANGFLVGAEGVAPPKPTEVTPGTGGGVNGNFAPDRNGNSHIDSTGNIVSDISTPPDQTLPIVPPVPIPPTPTPTPTPTPAAAPDFVTYNAIADVVSLSANTLLGTYHERMGSQNTAQVNAEKSVTYNSNSWGRLVADTREVAYDNAALNQSVDGVTTGFQLGHSFWQNRNANNTASQAGLAVGYVTGKMDVTGDSVRGKNDATGSVDADTTSLMAYYTLAADSGAYLDAVVQYSWSQSDAQGPQSNLSLDSTGLRGSMEAGVPVRFDSVTVEPQAQLVVYQDSFDDATDSGGYVMSQDDSSGVIFRVGARLSPSDTSSNFKPWFAANLNVQNGSTGTGVRDLTNQFGLSSEKDAKWADMSVGLSYQTSADLSVYGHLKQSVAIGGGTNTSTSGAIGVQKTW